MNVSFISITVWKAVFPLRVSFAHNLATRDEVETLVVAIGSSRGGVGYGQILPRPYLTGESIESALHDVRERWWPGVRAIALAADAGWDAAVASLRPLYVSADASRSTSSYAGVDVAALTAFASAVGIPACPARTRVESLPLVGVIPAAAPKKAAWLARLLRCMGYRRFKVKVGRDADADAERVRAVRRNAGAEARLDVDANGAWGWDEAVRRMRGLAALGVTLVEEPLDRLAAADADFGALEKEAGMPVMADESLCTLADAAGLLARGTPSWWNLRLAKNGGFSGVMELSRLAGEHGVSTYGGVLVGETGVLAAAGRAAFFSAGVTCCEYGFPRFFLRGDPARGSPAGYRGRYSPQPDSIPGLGVTVDDRVLRKRGEIVWKDG